MLLLFVLCVKLDIIHCLLYERWNYYHGKISLGK
ncbi:hypothetical protein SAMN05878391_1926 [Salinicoccus kekensis]|uniref:Uncharacterized protein n=2 Tax=Salinicoccus TaxID=45669 RepID=A0A285UMY0_9STAP|nr:hypothetical protein SAMN05878391_1926 [Salinicoccus kekensis]